MLSYILVGVLIVNGFILLAIAGLVNRVIDRLDFLVAVHAIKPENSPREVARKVLEMERKNEKAN